MNDDDKPVLHLWEPRPPSWLDQAWVEMVLGVVFVIVLALPMYTSFPRSWAFAFLVIWSVVITVLGLRPRGKFPTTKGGSDGR